MSTESVEWFNNNLKNIAENKIRSISDINSNNLNQAASKYKLISGFAPSNVGGLYMYIYDPKHKDVLPMYDTFPLIILSELKSDGFVGFNLHYLPALARSNILNQLILNNSKKTSNQTKLIANYQMLNNLQMSPLKVCYKRYLFNHLRSKVLQVPEEEWNKAVLLPTANFVYNKGKK